MSDWSVRRVHQVVELTGTATYLDVGVYGRDRFFPIAIRYKDAVDPAFRFNCSGMSSEYTGFLQMQSDEFFASALPRPQDDVIFLDGLHTFAQTFRDFMTTLPFSHGKTVWLIDDTVSCDPYSALWDMEHSYAERTKARMPWNPWHGDVYKVIYPLHDFCPNFNFARTVDGRNPQMVVRSEPRWHFAPAFSGFEGIERSSYFTLGEHEAVMRYQTETMALHQLAQFLGPLSSNGQSPVFWR